MDIHFSKFTFCRRMKHVIVLFISSCPSPRDTKCLHSGSTTHFWLGKLRKEFWAVYNEIIFLPVIYQILCYQSLDISHTSSTILWTHLYRKPLNLTFQSYLHPGKRQEITCSHIFFKIEFGKTSRIVLWTSCNATASNLDTISWHAVSINYENEMTLIKRCQ